MAVMSVAVVSVSPSETAHAAVRKMLDGHVGSVAVCDGARLVGIFTERDVLRLAGEAVDLRTTTVAEVMTPSPVTVSPDVDPLEAARLMVERRIRHLPVVEGDHLHGMIGIRDLLGTLVERVWRAHDEEAREAARQLFARPR
jgi:CBS domain-containing protein